MFKLVAATSTIAIIMSGCMSPAVHLYHDHETEFRNAAPDYQVGATGEITYCDAGLAPIVKSRRQESLQKISETCNGDNYNIIGETPSFYSGGSSCRHILTIAFKCNAKKKQ